MKKGKLVLKIVAGVLGLSIIGFVLYVANGLTGNPVSSALALRDIKSYVQKNYGDLNLTVGKVTYNFKTADYMARASSSVSEDTHFAVYWRNGKVWRDDYETYVVGLFNTYSRLEQEAGQQAKAVLAAVPGLEDIRPSVSVNKGDFESPAEGIYLDVPFDLSLPVTLDVYLNGEIPSTDLKDAARIITDAYQAFKRAGFEFGTYGMFGDVGESMVSVSNVTPEDIESGRLPELLEEARQKELEARENPPKDKESEPEEEPGIYVYIKE